jgi:integrase
VADVERWHSRLRRAGAGEASIRNRHTVLRAALTQACAWGLVTMNVAALAQLHQPRRPPRQAMSAADVAAVLVAARSIDPAAELALRLAAIGGLRRSELAALRWDDFHEDELTVDSSIVFIRYGDGSERTLADEATLAADLAAALRRSQS